MKYLVFGLVLTIMGCASVSKQENRIPAQTVDFGKSALSSDEIDQYANSEESKFFISKLKGKNHDSIFVVQDKNDRPDWAVIKSFYQDSFKKYFKNVSADSNLSNEQAFQNYKKLILDLEPNFKKLEMVGDMPKLVALFGQQGEHAIYKTNFRTRVSGKMLFSMTTVCIQDPLAATGAGSYYAAWEGINCDISEIKALSN